MVNAPVPPTLTCSCLSISQVFLICSLRFPLNAVIFCLWISPGLYSVRVTLCFFSSVCLPVLLLAASSATSLNTLFSFILQSSSWFVCNLRFLHLPTTTMAHQIQVELFCFGVGAVCAFTNGCLINTELVGKRQTCEKSILFVHTNFVICREFENCAHRFRNRVLFIGVWDCHLVRFS